LDNDEDAEDAVHMAFESIAKNISKIFEIDCPETRNFIVIIVERKAIDVLRKRKGYADMGLDEAISGIEITMPEGGGLANALAKLNPRYREILLLHYVSGYTAKEIAKMLDMKAGSVQKLIYRAKEALRKNLEKEDMQV
ncbi:MAG: sigma-70 family RNA polymerase sigma factor, partial [Clostridiales bacterium]|nr:sigma-70 family RNA polymerase sigma factor [Clostridiales bacterium]